MTAIPQQDRMTESVEKLSRQLELPHVPGELSSWTDEVVEGVRTAQAAVREAIEVDHKQAYKAILKNDLELARQVDLMRKEDEEILLDLEKLIQETDVLDHVVDEGSVAEQQFLPKRTKLVDCGLALTTRIRKQEAAVTTWQGESLRRDNGGQGG